MASRLKSKAAAYAPQTKTDCTADIKKLGDLQRQFQRFQADMNDEIAKIAKAAAPRLEELQQRIDVLQAGIQTFCEAHRDELCGADSKTANLVTGEVSWRVRPPSVSITGAEAVMDTLRRMGLERFIRQKSEVNKEAILNEKDAVRGIAGIRIVSGVEDFLIAPFEIDAEATS